MSESYTVLGMMSGSSLDGLDLAVCKFEVNNKNQWSFSILDAETIPYPDQWLNILTIVPESKTNLLLEKNISYGTYLGETAKTFLESKNHKVDFIASHGHTVFHNPEKGFSYQLGDGQALAIASNEKVICDFRTKDILLGGQGAPLVPVGDELLFSEFDVCLNLGGIANISYKENGKRVAHDVCPANQLLNILSKQLGYKFDQNGDLAGSGSVNYDLLAKLDQDSYYNKSQPKSLSNQYVQLHFIEIINDFNDTVENKLSTCVEHIVQQINRDTETLPKGKILSTGGGAHNTFLIRRLKEVSKHQIVVPEKTLIDFKEALIFAFMGVLRSRNETNCLMTVTGARTDSSAGVIYNP